MRPLIAELLGESGSGLDIQDHVAARAEGNPLFVEQMISMLIDEGVEQVDGRWVAVGDLENVTVPPGIHACWRRVSRLLGADERGVLGRAAVVGQVFYVGALEELASPTLEGTTPSLLLELAQGARPAGRSDFVGEEAFEFRHLLIRDAACDSLSKQSRPTCTPVSPIGSRARPGIAWPSSRRSAGTSSRHTLSLRARPLGDQGDELARRALLTASPAQAGPPPPVGTSMQAPSSARAPG